jgi:CDP-diacylglycerol--serine O-phosphatidyltransferase
VVIYVKLPFNIEIKEQDVATIVNLLFGSLAILFLVENYSANTSIAAAFVLICVLADGADGYLARTRGQGSLGFQLDSLADFISFGLLPSILVYYVVREAIGIRSLFFLIFIVSFLYTVSGMLRLARYNVAPQETIFYGLPITAGGLVIALYVLTGLPPAGLLIIALILAGLMVSEIKYPKIRNAFTLAIIGAFLVLNLILYAIGTSYSIVALVLLLLSIVYILNPLYRGYFR